jgi:hypothetical protein
LPNLGSENEYTLLIKCLMLTRESIDKVLNLHVKISIAI